MAYSLKAEKTTVKLQRIMPHLMYNIGRVITYTFLGALFGLLGAGLKNVIHEAQSVLFILAGLFMVGMGLDLAGWLTFSAPSRIPGLSLFKRSIGSLLANITSRNMLMYGLILGFIPCGLVYVAGAKATASASLTSGMLIMASFGLGTIPALFILGLGANLISMRFRKTVFKVAAVCVILFGLFTIFKGGMKLAGKPMPWMQHSVHSVKSDESCCSPLPDLDGK